MTSPTRTGLSVKTFPVYYGWVITLVGVLGMVASSPGQTYAISIFLDPLLDEFSLTRTTFATFYLMATLTSSFILPKVGVAVDNLGCRRAMTLISIALGVSLLLASRMTTLWHLAIVLLLLRLFGQGSMTLVSTTMVNQWWRFKRGRVMGLVGLLSAVLGVGCFPPVIHYLIERFGWRGSFLWEAAFMLVIMTPIALLAARHRPEDHGLATDGDVPVQPREGEVVEVEGLTKMEAQKTPIFWVATMAVGMQAMMVTGLHFHAVGLFTDKGLSAATAAATYFPIAATASIVTFLSGWWVERISVIKLMGFSLLCLSGSLLAAARLHEVVPVLAYALILGATGGLFRTVSSVVWSQLFGRKALGAITGAATTFMVAGSAFGPLPMGWARDEFGSFDMVLLALAALPFTLALITFSLERYSDVSA